MGTTVVRTPTSRCRVGISRADITPPVGIYHRMWGAARHDRAAGVHRPLRATVLIFEPNSGEADARRYLVALDHCLLRPDDMDELHRAVAQRLKIHPSVLTVIFSHTHSGGLLVRSRADLPGGELIGPYLDELPDRIASAANSALQTMKPVVMTYATVSCDMARNRDYQDDDNGLVVCGFNPDDVANSGGFPLQVVRITGEERGDVVAVVVNYPCHPTTLAWDNELISPDYVGALRETVESATGASCLFILAPCGDVGPRHGFVGEVTVADSNGRQVGYAALGALESMPAPLTEQLYAGPVISGATIGAWEFRSFTPGRRDQVATYRSRSWVVDLNYRSDLPTLDAAHNELESRQAAESAAAARGDETEVLRLRALVERQRRLIERIQPLRPGSYPYLIRMQQIGDAIWIELEGEPYYASQEELQRRYPDVPLLFAVLANGSKPSYLPRRDDYAKPLYQVEVSLLAPGSLERLIEEISAQVEQWRTSDL